MKEIILDEEKLTEFSSLIDMKKEAKLAQQIIRELKEIVEAKNLVSLSAPQIGYPYRIFVIKFKDAARSFINPVISRAKGFQLSKERCSSIPGKEFLIPRQNDIELFYTTPLNKYEAQQFIGFGAFVVQHEIDHLDGILVSNMGLEIDDDFEKATDEEKTEIISAYLDSLDLRAKKIKDECEKDEEFDKAYKTMKFMQEVNAGNIKLNAEEDKKDANQIEENNKEAKNSN